MTSAALLHKLNLLNTIGISLSTEKDYGMLLEKILLGGKELTSADGGTLYTVSKGGILHFEIVVNDSLHFLWRGGSSPNLPLPAVFPDIPLYLPDGTPNETLVVAYAVLHNKTVNIPNAYEANGFDFRGTQKFDAKTGYRSTSFLTVPMRNHENRIIGVLQLINALDPQTKQPISFTQQDQEIVESLASQAAVTMTKNSLIQDLKELFESFIQVIAAAIDAKSPYTGEHCRKVPVIASMIAEAVNTADKGVFKDFRFTQEELYELHVAALLHDCGKVTTPVHVVDKSTKLETIFNRIHLIGTRFEVLRRDLEIALLTKRLSQEEYQQEIQKLEEDWKLLQSCNLGGEQMSDELIAEIGRIARRKWVFKGGEQPVLTGEEVENLCIRKGTLNERERQIINDHVVQTKRMLDPLPYPEHLKRVPEIAGAHHERVDGKGYPAGLTRNQMSLQARILAVADVFEALTARSRPYKPGHPLSKVMQILARMKDEGHIDPDVYDVFVQEGIAKKYGREWLTPDQMDI